MTDIVVEEKKPVQSEIVAQESVKTEEKPKEESQEQINWKRFREQREIERKEKMAAEKKALEKEAEAKALKEAMEALLNKQPKQSKIENEYREEIEESEDDKIQKKVDAALQAREQQYEMHRKQKEQAEFPQRLASTYKDFDTVCTADNLDYLEYHYPEVAEPYKHLPDGYDKWSAIYKAVKRFVPNTDTKKDQAKAEKNYSKPQSMSVPGVTQTGDSAPYMLDSKKKSNNWERMQRVMKGAQ